MKIQTINQLVSVWKDIATRHYQINGFGVGESWEVGADKAYLHPVLWINPVSASMPSSDNGYKTFEIDFEVRLFDLVDKDESNENHVLSDTIDILKDIITEFKGHPYYVNSQLNIIGDIEFEAFTEEFDEEVSGWLCEISLMTPVLTSFCGIPSAEITGFEFPGVDCPDINVLCPVFVEEVTGVYPIVVTNIGTTRQVSLDPSGISNVNLVSTNFVGNTLTCLMSDGTILTADIDNFNGLSVAGTIDATSFTGDGSLLTGIQSDKLSSIGFVGNTLTATLTDGTVLTTSVDNFNGLTVNGTVGATSFTGDGSLLTGISSGNPVVSSSFSNNILSLTLQDATVINATINTFDDLTINGELVQHISTTPTPDVNLLNDSLVLHIEGSNTLAGRYKDNLGVVSDLTIGENIANSDLTFDDNHYTDLNSKTLTIDGTAPIGVDAKFSVQTNSEFKGLDDSLNTKIISVINDSEDDLFNIRGNGQSCFGGAKVKNTAHIFYNPSNQVSSLARFIDNDGTVGINLGTKGRIETSNSAQGLIFRTYATGGVPHIELYHSTRGQIVDLQSGESHIDSTSLVIGDQTGITGAKFCIIQSSTSVNQQKFFGNITTTTAGRTGSSAGFGADQKGFECFDTDLNRKFVWDGVEWKSIAWLSDFEVGTTVKTPTSTGVSGQTSYNNGFLYTCVDTDTWVRSTVDTSF